MAKYQGEEKSGKLGKVIYSSWHGRPYVRQMPETVANPRTELQQAHRNAFAAISKLSSDLKEVHLIGLYNYALREKLDTYSVFKKINKDCCIGGVISYPCIVVSKGPVDMVRVTSVEVDDQRVLHVTFDSEVTEKNAMDMIGLFVYCPELRVCKAVPPVLRSAGVASVELTEELIRHKWHLYGFVQDEKRRTSDTIYVAI
jgi:hypothetical protein